ncbi:hypothetical protein NW752_000166 [Fusarium irregulare]|nr:hypothetical protein NW752_000166 [Fusarium irregulare]
MIYTGDVITELTAAPERTSMFDTGEQRLLYYGKLNPTKPVAGYDLLNEPFVCLSGLYMKVWSQGSQLWPVRLDIDPAL